MLVPVVLVFVWSSSVVEPVSILVIVIPVWVVLISLFIPQLLLVTSVSAVVSVVVLSVVPVIVT